MRQKKLASNEKFRKRSEIEKKAHALEKGSSLHTGGTISHLTRKKRMEKELGRSVTQEELSKVTRTWKNKDGLSHVLKRHMIGLRKKFKIIVVSNLLSVRMQLNRLEG